MNLDYAPVLDEEDRPAGVIAIVVETTQRVLADRRVAAEQQRQRQLLQQMPGFIGVVSGPEHVYEYVNDAYVKISERTEFIGRRFRDVFADLADQSFAELLDQVYATGESVVMRGMELRLHGSRAEPVHRLSVRARRDEARAVTGVFIGGYEITEAYPRGRSAAIQRGPSPSCRRRRQGPRYPDDRPCRRDHQLVARRRAASSAGLRAEVLGKSSSIIFLPEDRAAGSTA